MGRITRLFSAIALCLAAGLPAVVGGQGGIASGPARFLAPAEQVVAVRAGRLFDSRSGSMAANQIILVKGDRITAVGPAVAVPAGATVIDLSAATVLP